MNICIIYLVWCTREIAALYEHVQPNTAISLRQRSDLLPNFQPLGVHYVSHRFILSDNIFQHIYIYIYIYIYKVKAIPVTGLGGL
jgi:hypothetical protein